MRAISESICTAVCQAYEEGQGSTNIGKKYGLSKFLVWGILRKRGVPIRSKAAGHHRLRVNEAAFDSLTEESAYWAGFLMADGCISERPPWQPQVILALEKPDQSHVEAFRTFLGSDHKIADVERVGATGAKEKSCRLAVVSSRLASALAKYGVVPRKTFTAEASGLVANDKHFWRGVVDGDGHIPSDTYRAVVTLLGTETLCHQFASFCSNYVREARAAYLPRKGCTRISYSGEAAWGILKLLYEEASISLWRKHALAMEMVNRHAGKKWRKRRTPVE